MAQLHQITLMITHSYEAAEKLSVRKRKWDGLVVIPWQKRKVHEK
jgi:hypothetical protein